MRRLVLVLLVGLQAAVSSAETLPGESPAERVQRLQIIIEFCQADTDLAPAATVLATKLDDLESLLDQAGQATADYSISAASLELATSANRRLASATNQLIWQLMLHAEPDSARADDGLSSPAWFSTLDVDLATLDSALYRKWFELGLHIERDHTGQATLAVLQAEVLRMRCDANLAHLIIAVAGKPETDGGIQVEDRLLTPLLELIKVYAIPLGDNFHSVLLKQSSAAQGK